MNGLYLYSKGLAGYFQDLYRIARLNFSNPHSYTKFLLIDRVRKNTGATILIEAGTFRGITTARASSVFDQVYSIELDKTLAAVHITQPSFYLLRPDGHVGLCGGTFDGAALTKYLRDLSFM